jgi:phosphate:Na+ symporter
MEMFGTVFAGLGLFFIGVKQLSANMKLLTGHRFRALLSRLTAKPILAGGFGVLAGALTQSASAMTYTVTSMVSVGLMEARQAIPIMVWSNVGAVMLVMIATVDIHLFVMYMLGITGLLFYFNLNDSERFKPLVGALFSACVLLLGLWFIKSEIASFNESVMLSIYLSEGHISLFWLFMMGLVLSIVTHSTMVVAALAVVVAASGLLSLEQILILICGANIGPSVSFYLAGKHIQGQGRALIYIQMVLRMMSVLIVLPLLWLETSMHWPSLLWGLKSLSDSLATQAVLATLGLQLLGALIATIVGDKLLDGLSQWLPADNFGQLSRPKYLYHQALQEGDAALLLLESEHGEQLRLLPHFLDTLRSDEVQGKVIATSVYYAACRQVTSECKRFISELMARDQAATTLEGAVNVQSRTELLFYLQEACRDLVVTLSKPFAEPSAEQTKDTLVEGLHSLLIFLRDDFNADDLNMLLMMSSDRSGLMESLRNRLLQSEASLSFDSQSRLFAATSLLERIVWLINSYASLLKREREID